ncbi:hypothetical protein ACIRRH_35810 [Kitasatospora sp. NPDC101235]|uniref:hypothetical protein n=1 Tax=Kitasatospora sp. NPDC101235 TaxID=3364101 RepID=UPI0037FEA257
MHDPELPDHIPASTGSDAPDNQGNDGALNRIGEKIEEVAAWCTEQIHVERRRPASDLDRVEQLLAEHAAILKTLRDLPEASAQELERIEAFYDARLSEIAGS